MQQLINEEALVSAYATYLNQADFASAMSWCRALRLAGRADEAQDICLRWTDKVDGAFECAQLGIDMNYLGMFAQSEAQLSAAAESFPYGTNRHLLMSELAIAKYRLGKYHEAHEIFRSLRDRGESENLVRLLYPVSSDEVLQHLQRKLLALSDPVAGRRVGILQEGGIGDLIMYSRYVERLLEEGASSVCIQVPASLHGCIRTDPRVTVVDRLDAEILECDDITTMFSLFARYQISPYFPNTKSSMIAVPACHVLPASLTTLMDDQAPKRKVGLIWRSASGVRQEPYRSLDLGELVPLLENPSCRFFSLQVDGLSEAEKALFAEHDIVDLSPYLDTFADTAAVIQKLDLLISVDTGPAHLAATLDCPIWLLLSQACDSRWYDSQRFTPWYTSMRLFRQRRLGDWSAPLHDAKEALARPVID
ncbi:glycosyltransferase family 9 protein [Paraburkholderia antibiotica]|uniref:Glycosyltransferase family 9 protein n=1 Tax=Paraburkholderia antibiotica TaxID=2728839 RepID=A0A7X9ZVW8_9BURK|nr:glycosyltransferase family 9 protein [Paraburkholderia antibiotica]NML30081.1 glycosyltransferase family 9 protein [Paraburkholderia antibiotica]